MRSRVLEPEVMDDPTLDRGVHQRALQGLRRLNRVSGSAGLLFRAMRDMPRTHGRPLRILDIATGGGDVPLALCRRFRRAGVDVEIAGCDISNVAVDHARQQAAQAAVDVEFFQLDALHDPTPTGYDAITCSLFLHHLSHDHAVNLLRRMAAATEQRIVVNDLCRSRANLAMVYVASRLVTRCGVVHTDGPRSVRAAFTLDEAAGLAHEAGLANAKLQSRFPCRFLLTWNKP